MLASPDGSNWTAVLKDRARLDRVRENLRPTMLALPLDAARVGDSLESAELSALGVQRVVRCLADDRTPSVLLLSATEVEVGGDAKSFASWLDRLLDRLGSKGAKLAAMSAEQAHLFVWATSDSGYGAIGYLEDLAEENPRLPERPPRLPAGVTHLWVACSVTGRMAIRWSPDLGWSRCDWVTLLEHEFVQD